MSWSEVKKINSDLGASLDKMITSDSFLMQHNYYTSELAEAEVVVNSKILLYNMYVKASCDGAQGSIRIDLGDETIVNSSTLANVGGQVLIGSLQSISSYNGENSFSYPVLYGSYFKTATPNNSSYLNELNPNLTANSMIDAYFVHDTCIKCDSLRVRCTAPGTTRRIHIRFLYAMI